MTDTVQLGQELAALASEVYARECCVGYWEYNAAYTAVVTPASGGNGIWLCRVEGGKTPRAALRKLKTQLEREREWGSAR